MCEKKAYASWRCLCQSSSAAISPSFAAPVLMLFERACAHECDGCSLSVCGCKEQRPYT